MYLLSIEERLRKSANSIHIDPVPDVTPNQLQSDCLATFFDHHKVTDDCEKDHEKMNELVTWLVDKINKELPDLVARNLRLSIHLRERFSSPTNPDGDFSLYRLNAEIIDHKFDQTPDGPIYCKFWFKILR